MGFDKETARSWRYLSLISQLAISMITPVLLMIFVCIWLKNKFGLGNWVVMAGMLLGIGSGLSSVWTYLKRFLREGEKQQQEYEDKFR
ncbi:MAG: AtpZ/AtpI family protein [Oscillospiraceae bacterium]|nr:AtpZ/AtpI family protein [Oscillospiraceae bacterium]